MDELLNRQAVACLHNDEANHMLEAFLSTGPGMVFHHSATSPASAGTGAGDNIKPR